MLGRGPMGRPSLLCGDAAAVGEQDAKLVADLLCEYIELMTAADYSEGLRVARVKQWLSLGAKVNSNLRPLFESVKRLENVREMTSALAD
jgi:tRNA-dihydrouridine synthase